ncbi:MAG: class I SAM-dependent methyltransferase [Deltaproteobacteria bacterium]|nr:class I SAM-dependent methyltransferase [Deltaproteobacteria bacterium]
MNDWFKKEEFWSDFGPVMFNQTRLEATAVEVEQLIALVSLQRGARVLDLPCGMGRYTLELARRGMEVTAVDLTESYLDNGKEQARIDELEVEFLRADMRDFRRESTFDAAVNLFTSFGYFEDRADDQRMLDNFYYSLRPGGVLVMEMFGKEIAARVFVERVWSEEPDGTLLLEERSLKDGWSRIENRWILVKNGVQKEYRFELRIYGAAELGMMLEQAGFCDVEFFGNLEGKPYDQQAERLVAVARKRQ